MSNRIITVLGPLSLIAQYVFPLPLISENPVFQDEASKIASVLRDFAFLLDSGKLNEADYVDVFEDVEEMFEDFQVLIGGHTPVTHYEDHLSIRFSGLSK